jgi:hypothetical protein
MMPLAVSIPHMSVCRGLQPLLLKSNSTRHVGHNIRCAMTCHVRPRQCFLVAPEEQLDYSRSRALFEAYSTPTLVLAAGVLLAS